MNTGYVVVGRLEGDVPVMLYENQRRDMARACATGLRIAGIKVRVLPLWRWDRMSKEQRQRAN